MELKKFIQEELLRLHQVTLLENKKIELEKILNEEIVRNKYGDMTIDKPIIKDAIELLSKNPDAHLFNNKSEFDSFLKKQRYFSASESHCYYTLEDYLDSHKASDRWRDGSRGISEADRGCFMLFETGHELVAVWSEKDSIGYIVRYGV